MIKRIKSYGLLAVAPIAIVIVGLIIRFGPVVIFAAAALYGFGTLMWLGYKVGQEINQVWQKWREFKKEVRSFYPRRLPESLYVGCTVVVPKFNFRPVTLTNGTVWTSHYCERRNVVEFVDPNMFRAPVYPKKGFPVFKTVETFALPTVGKVTKVPYLRLVS